MNIYRFCIEKALLNKNQISQTTFYRFIREYDLLTPDAKENKKRLAFSMQYANQLWQADTMFGPYVTDGKKQRQAKLIAFLDDASRVLYHGEFFFASVPLIILNCHSRILLAGIQDGVVFRYPIKALGLSAKT